MSELFKTQKANQSHAKTILNETPEGCPLDGDNLAFMLEYFERFHCEWDRKKGAGIKGIDVVKEPFKGYGSYKSFMLRRVDGTRTDISYNIGKIKKINYRRKFIEALRHLVQPQIDEFRSALFSGRAVFCEVSGKELTPSSCHIDHFTPTFAEIVSSFLLGKEIDFKSVLSLPKDNDYYRYITDDNIKSSFLSHHSMVAVLRAISIESNLNRGC